MMMTVAAATPPAPRRGTKGPRDSSPAGRAIRLLIKNLSIREVAKRAGIDNGYLSRALAGQRRLSMPLAARLAKALGMTLDELYDRLEAIAIARQAAVARKPAKRARKAASSKATRRRR